MLSSFSRTIILTFLLTACAAAPPQGGGTVGAPQAPEESVGGVPEGGAGQEPAVVVREDYENQDRNQPCWENADCLSGLRCKDVLETTPGTCQLECEEDADCGNGFLCRNGNCQRDCAGVGEKCSDRRVCCFEDRNGDGKTDAACSPDAAGDLRCITR
jgi:hypothetical protein